ncbi:Rossmann-fold NAD(P)-binding domain-containing protein [Flindersiella endophytica]
MSSVLISGASVAGPALAYWLGRNGHDVTVVEIAPALRPGGQAVDFRGRTHLTVLERMGVLDDLRQVRTGGSPWRFVDADGRQLAALPGEFAGGELEVHRGDLARVLYEHSAPRAEYVFGDSITALRETADGVDVEFRHAPARRFDLVVGADGLHSNVRRLAFGPEEEFVRYLGYYIATWSLPNTLGLGETALLHNVPGKLVSVGADQRDPSRAGVLVAFASERIDYDRHDVQQQKAILAERFAGLGWETPRLLAALADADDLYFDSISRADVPHWSRERVVLLGDAAHGATLGGMGTGAAIVGAYVLAGELAGADRRTAFARYETKLRKYATNCQRGGNRAGRFLAPLTARGLAIRNWMFNVRWLVDLNLKLGKKVTSDIPLETYPGTDSLRAWPTPSS